MSASSDSRDSESESEESSVSIDRPFFRRHKDSICESTSSLSPLTFLKSRLGRRKSPGPSPSSFDLILEDDSADDLPLDNPVGSTPPIPDLLCHVPKVPSSAALHSAFLKTPRKKSVRFKVPVWEQINDQLVAIPSLDKKRVKKMKGVIKHFPVSRVVVQEFRFDPVPKHAQVIVLDDRNALFTNSQRVRWNLRWRRVRHKFILSFMIFVILLFLFPIVRFILT